MFEHIASFIIVAIEQICSKIRRETMIRNSFEGKESLDLASVIAEFPHNDENPHKIPVKKLSQVFDSCVKTEGEEYMKVYLRVRPIPNNAETTIIVESENTIVTNAPDSSKRALYTKTESRHYVRLFFPFFQAF